MKFKNAISPVVAIALLLVVSVVAVVGYQTWYQSYQSTLFANTEQKSQSSGGGISVEYITSDGMMYVYNRGNKNATLNSIDVGGVDCNINEEIAPGVTNISIASCLNASGTNDVVIKTDSGIYEKKLFVEEVLDLNSEPQIISYWNTSCDPIGVGSDIFVDNTGIYAVGYSGTPSFIRYNSDGNQTLNRSISFGIEGIVQYNNNLYLTGWDSNIFQFAKWSIDGNSIWNITNDLSGGDDRGNAITFDTDGIYIAGYDAVPGNTQIRIEKRGFDGSSIWNVTSNPTSNMDSAVDIEIGTDGIYIGGWENTNGWRYEKRGFDGSSIWNVTSDPGGTNDKMLDMALGSDGIYAVGYDTVPGNAQIRIEKRGFDGSSIWNVSHNPNTGWDQGSSVVVGTDGIYVGAADTSGNPIDAQIRIEKRGFDGSSIWNFTSNPTGSGDYIRDMQIYNNALYLIGSMGGCQIQKRSLIDASQN